MAKVTIIIDYKILFDITIYLIFYLTDIIEISQISSYTYLFISHYMITLSELSDFSHLTIRSDVFSR